MRMRKTVISLLAVLLFALGVTVCAYPYMQGHERDKALQHEVDTFLLRLETTPEEPAETLIMELQDAAQFLLTFVYMTEIKMPLTS